MKDLTTFQQIYGVAAIFITFAILAIGLISSTNSVLKSDEKEEKIGL
jgi:hypothetical protein